MPMPRSMAYYWHSPSAATRIRPMLLGGADATWWSRVLLPIMEKHHPCYFLPWRNFKREHFGAAPGIATADDFKQMAKDKKILFVKDIKKVK